MRQGVTDPVSTPLEPDRSQLGEVAPPVITIRSKRQDGSRKATEVSATRSNPGSPKTQTTVQDYTFTAVSGRSTQKAGFR